MFVFFRFLISPIPLIIGLAVVLPALPLLSAQGAVMNKSDLIKDLTQIKTRHLERLHNIEKEITSTLAATENTAPPEAKVFDDSRSAQFVNAQVLNLRTLLLEEKYRLQFIDQLIFQCDSHYEGQELSGFFHITLQKMAKVSATAEQAQAWKFIHQTAMAMKSLSERRENPLELFLDTSIHRLF